MSSLVVGGASSSTFPQLTGKTSTPNVSPVFSEDWGNVGTAFQNTTEQHSTNATTLTREFNIYHFNILSCRIYISSLYISSLNKE